MIYTHKVRSCGLVRLSEEKKEFKPNYAKILRWLEGSLSASIVSTMVVLITFYLIIGLWCLCDVGTGYDPGNSFSARFFLAPWKFLLGH